MSIINYFQQMNYNKCDLFSHLYNAETQGLTEDFIATIYEMPEEMFKNYVRNNSLPELPKLPFPKNANYPLIQLTDLNEDIYQFYHSQEEAFAKYNKFEDWLYYKRTMLQYFTAKELFANSIFGYESNQWIDELLQKKCDEPVNNNAADTFIDEEEFKYYLDWDIEKGNFEKPQVPKLRLYLPEEVGFLANDDELN